MDELENEIKLSPPSQKFDDDISAENNEIENNKIKSSDGKLAVKPISSTTSKPKPAKIAV